MKKWLITVLALALLLTALGGCAAREETEAQASGGLRIVTTVFPVYDWTKNILGDQAGVHSLQLLLKDGADLAMNRYKTVKKRKKAETEIPETEDTDCSRPSRQNVFRALMMTGPTAACLPV